MEGKPQSANSINHLRWYIFYSGVLGHVPQRHYGKNTSFFVFLLSSSGCLFLCGKFCQRYLLFIGVLTFVLHTYSCFYMQGKVETDIFDNSNNEKKWLCPKTLQMQGIPWFFGLVCQYCKREVCGFVTMILCSHGGGHIMMGHQETFSMPQHYSSISYHIIQFWLWSSPINEAQDKGGPSLQVHTKFFR